MSSLPSNIVGWDIGGAHLKVALLNTKCEVINCFQLPCQLWKGLDNLQRAILHALEALRIGPSGACHAITMTGELVDLFENRQQGVQQISNLCAKLLGKYTFFYAAPSANQTGGFVHLARVSECWQQIASTNWHASASALATQVSDALFVDIGSTTTDVIAIEGGKVVSAGISDAYRMQADSLVYTGVVRTPVMALAQKLTFDNAEINVAAEYFATMADIYSLTGELTKDDAETADGKGKTMLESARRLARMIGHDVENKPLESWKNLAYTCKKLQMNQIKTAMLKQLKPNMIIIGAGAGSFLVEQIAHELRVTWEPISMRVSRMNNQLQLVYSAVMPRTGTEHVNSNLKHDVEVCFPAFAVAILAQKYQLC